MTPFKELAEAHSLALSGGRLLVSYCECDGRTGGVVCYAYDDETGGIGEPLSLTEHWFRVLGDPKGVTFMDHGRRALVSFNSLKPNPPLQRLYVRSLRRWYRNRGLPLRDVMHDVWNTLLRRKAIIASQRRFWAMVSLCSPLMRQVSFQHSPSR